MQRGQLTRARLLLTPGAPSLARPAPPPHVFGGALRVLQIQCQTRQPPSVSTNATYLESPDTQRPSPHAHGSAERRRARPRAPPTPASRTRSSPRSRSTSARSNSPHDRRAIGQFDVKEIAHRHQVVLLRDTDQVDDQTVLLARMPADAPSHHLHVERTPLRRPGDDDRIRRRLVVALGQNPAVRDHADLAAAEGRRTDAGCSRGVDSSGAAAEVPAASKASAISWASRMPGVKMIALRPGAWPQQARNRMVGAPASASPLDDRCRPRRLSPRSHPIEVHRDLHPNNTEIAKVALLHRRASCSR